MHSTGWVLTADLLAGELLLLHPASRPCIRTARRTETRVERLVWVPVWGGDPQGAAWSPSGVGQRIHQHLPVLSVSQGSSGG